MNEMVFSYYFSNYGLYFYKVVIYNYVFVGFYSVPNLIVIMFNLMYPDFMWVLFVRVVCERKRI